MDKFWPPSQCKFAVLILGHFIFFRLIDKEEFKKIMALMRSFNRQGATHKDGLRIGLKVGQPVENGGVVEFFFGNDGNEPLHYDKFTKFLKDLHDEVIYFYSFVNT